MTATRLTLACLVPVLGLLTAGCGDHGYTFSTTATYDIPALGFRADITSAGSVDPGADLSSDGSSRIVLTRLGSPTVPVATLQTSNRVASVASGETITYTIGTNAPITLPWGSIASEESLKIILPAAGFTNDVPAALAEAHAVIYGAGLGPKSTPISSSTQVIVVKVKRDFTR